MNIELKHTRALVTGASRGIGKAIALALMDSGARVVVHYRSEKASAEALARKHAGSVALGADLSDPHQCTDLFKRAQEALGGINLLVNNAGIAISSPMDSGEDWVADWDRTMAVNLTSAAILSREAITAALSRGDLRIVYLGSRAAFRGDTPDYLAYAASKGGMTSLARSIARG
ncbi:MAG TPA: SDR family oxidoreductase, partial [Candidatus Krumholzibacteria bacterium]|nr:SDR family oxidoreductase [Candidatus Krumholzibacteria bacterium]